MKRIRFLATVFILIHMLLQGATLQQQLQLDMKSGKVDRRTSTVYQMLSIYDPLQLPADYQSLISLPVKSGFGVNLQVMQLWDTFSDDQKSILEPFMMRPSRSTLPEEFVSQTGLFRIHYTNQGRNAVPQDDSDASGIPDYVELAATAFDSAYTVEVLEFGFDPPPSDNNVDGPEWDVYLQNMWQYGSTTPETKLSSSPDVWTGYLNVENDYAESFYTKGNNGLRVTAAHEFMHMIHLGYNLRDDNGYVDQFLMEMSSTWMEDAVYDNVNDYYQYLGVPYMYTGNGVFDGGNMPFDTFNGWYEYGMSIWFHYLDKRFESQLAKGEIMKRVWEALVDVPALEALDRVLYQLNSSFQEELATFYAWNYRTGSRADTDLYYPEGNAYPEMVLDGQYAFSVDTTINEAINPTAARYFHFTQERDGNSFVLIPVNLKWNEADTLNSVVLAIVNGESRENYTAVSESVLVRLVTDEGFHCSAFSETNQGFEYIPSVQISNFSKDDLPASYPNPFLVHQHSAVSFPFYLTEPGFISLGIFTAAGYPVYHYDIYMDRAGIQNLKWNGLNDAGNLVAGGIYLYAVWDESGLVRREKFAVIR